MHGENEYRDEWINFFSEGADFHHEPVFYHCKSRRLSVKELAWRNLFLYRSRHIKAKVSCLTLFKQFSLICLSLPPLYPVAKQEERENGMIHIFHFRWINDFNIDLTLTTIKSLNQIRGSGVRRAAIRTLLGELMKFDNVKYLILITILCIHKRMS